MTTAGGAVGQTRRERLSFTFRARLYYEFALVGSLAVAAHALATAPQVVDTVPAKSAYLVLTLAAAGISAAAAILADLTASITNRPAEATRLSLVAGALAVYGMVVMPFSAARSGVSSASPALQLGGVVSCIAVAALLLAALTEQAPRWARWWVSFMIAAAVSVSAATLAAQWPVLTSLLVGAAWPEQVVAAVWFAVAAAFSAHGMWHRQALTWRIGVGVAVLGCGHLPDLFGVMAPHDVAYVFPVLRLLGIGVVVFALACESRRLLAASRRRQRLEAQQAAASVRELRATKESTRVRDHEIRNLVAGLSGVSHVLGCQNAQDDSIRELGSALHAELQRLRVLVDGSAGTAEDCYADVPRVLTRLVLLHRADGAQIELDTEQDLAGAIQPSILAQVVTNLLANCNRHAPGASVYIRASCNGENVRIEVHDDGPGVTSPVRGALPEHYDRAAGGLGVGLRESSELLERHGAALRLGPSLELSGVCATVDIPTIRTRCMS